MINEIKSQYDVKTQKSQSPERSTPIENAAYANLSKRGISEPAWAMCWKNGRNGWEYPVSDTAGQVIAKRLKKYDSSAVPKYLWLDDTKANYYHIGAGLLPAIAAAGGALIIANGEPAVLACHAAGLKNVISFFGENRIPKDTLIDDLKTWGVKIVYYYPDKDNAGKTAAESLRDVLLDSDIYFDCRALPDALADGSDLNDLWQLVGFDRVAFVATLDSLTAQILPEPKPKPATIEYSTEGNTGDLPEALIADITKSLVTGSQQPRLKGDWFGAVQCPVGHHEHDHQNPAAYWSVKTNSLKCHKCGGKAHNAHTTATALGLDVSSYYPKREAGTIGLKSATVADSARAEKSGLPMLVNPATDAILSSILRCHPKVVPLFYIVATSGLDTFTREQIKIIADGRGMSEVTFNRNWPFLFLPELSLLECIREGVIHSKSDNCRILPSDRIIAQLREMEAKRVNIAYHPTGAPPKFGDEDTRVVALQTAAMVRDSGIDEGADTIAAELNQKLEPAFDAQGHQELKSRAAAQREFRRICDSFDDPHQTFIPTTARIHTVPDLRAAYANAYASEHEGERISRATWKRVLGCSDSGLKEILARAGVKGETPDELPSLEIRTPQDIERIISHGRTVKGFPLKVVYTESDGQEVTRGIDARSNPQGMHRVCEMALQSGTAVKVIYQTAKEYHVASEPLPTKERVITKVGQGETVKKIDFAPPQEQVESEPTDPRKYPRRWLVGQYQLALERMGWKRDKFGVCSSEGEYAPDNPRELIEMILGRSLVPNDTDPDYYERESTPDELAARHDFRMELINQGYRPIRERV